MNDTESKTLLRFLKVGSESLFDIAHNNLLWFTVRGETVGISLLHITRVAVSSTDIKIWTADDTPYLWIQGPDYAAAKTLIEQELAFPDLSQQIKS
jgi:hypothetical protein